MKKATSKKHFTARISSGFFFGSVLLMWFNISAQNSWLKKADLTGMARERVVAFSIDAKGYIAGGVGTGGSMNDFWEWDKNTNTWTQKASMPTPGRYWAIGFSIGLKGYVGLGRYDAATFYDDFWEWDQASNTWTGKSGFPGLTRSEAAAFSIGTRGYIGTGHDDNSVTSKEFWEWDQLTDTWTQLSDFGGSARFAAVGFSINGKGYIGTGGATIFTVLKDFWEYDPGSGVWTRKADFGGGNRYYAAAFSIGAKGYIGTGHNGIAPGRKKDFWEYDPLTDTWIQRANFGGAERYSAVGFSIGIRGYIGTGNVDIAGPQQDLWEYSPVGLPVIFASLTGFSKDRKNIISWETDIEYNVMCFVVERRNSANAFIPVGSIPAKGGKSGYTWSESGMTLQLSYYRVIAIDLDGKETESGIIEISSAEEVPGIQSISPNPAAKITEVMIFIPNENMSHIRLTLFDSLGKVVSAKLLSGLSAGSHTTRFDVKDLCAGLYYIEISGETFRRQEKILVVKL